MRIKLSVIGLLALFMVIGGCTSFGGITKAEKPDSYYITATHHTLGMFLTRYVFHCTSVPGSNGLQCEYVDITYK